MSQSLKFHQKIQNNLNVIFFFPILMKFRSLFTNTFKNIASENWQILRNVAFCPWMSETDRSIHSCYSFSSCIQSCPYPGATRAGLRRPRRLAGGGPALKGREHRRQHRLEVDRERPGPEARAAVERDDLSCWWTRIHHLTSWIGELIHHFSADFSAKFRQQIEIITKAWDLSSREECGICRSFFFMHTRTQVDLV